MKLAIEGIIVPILKSRPRDSFAGRVYLRVNGRIAGTRRLGEPAPNGFDDATVVDVGNAFIYPGLIDLHSHIAYNALPLWHRDDEKKPYLHHDIWPGRDGYRQSVGWPAWLLAKGAPEALMTYVQVQALAGGTTAIQGWPTSNRRPTNQLIRNIDDQSFPDEWDGRDNIRTSALTLDGQELETRADALEDGMGFIYHCAEGQRDSIVVREFDALTTANCLRDKLIAIHCCAVGGDAFLRWKRRSELAGDESPGGTVWSPFSNLWLYGADQTTDVPAALAQGVTVSIGTDWGPSGTKNLLGELKAARLCADDRGWDLSDFDLVEMVTGSPGDMMQRCWGKRVGRLATNGLGDLAVVTQVYADPWRNLVAATEEQVVLVLVDGRPQYGTRELMRASGVSRTTSVGVGSERRHVSLIRPADDAAGGGQRSSWTWTDVLDRLDAVRARPTLEAVTASASASSRNGGLRADSEALALELDMPGALGQLAGPPPPGEPVDIKPIPSLRHDQDWRRDVKNGGFHGGVYDDMDRFF